MELVAELKKDHQTIKKLYTTGLKEKSTFDAKKKLFKQLSMVVPAHSKSEEEVLYSNVTGVGKINHFAYEGFEKHGLIDQLLRELKHINERHVWEAKFAVACELLKQHFEEEEEDFFPKLTKTFSPEIRKDLGAEYRSRFNELSEAPPRESESQYIPTHAAH